MSGDSDQELNQRLVRLLAKSAQSDEKAFSEVYQLTSSKLFAVLVRMLGMNAAAEQALHDTYVSIWLKANEYLPEIGDPMPWLTSMARTEALDVLRADDDSSAGTNLASFSDSGSVMFNNAQITFLEKSPEAQNLEMCLNRLPDEPRECLVRAYVEGRSHEQLSDMNEVPIATVKGWINHGLLSLKGCRDGLS